MLKKKYTKIAKEVILKEILGLKKLYSSINNSFNRAIELISRTQGKVVFCGIGKSGS